MQVQKMRIIAQNQCERDSAVRISEHIIFFLQAPCSHEEADSDMMA